MPTAKRSSYQHLPISSLLVSSLLVSPLLVLGLTSCSYFESQSLPETGLSTTATGAAIGAVAGAGLGAIVGSATGDAGAGLVIGTVAGSATGALVGSQLEKQSTALNDQQEALKRQQEELSGNRRQIDELRRQNSSTNDAKSTVNISRAESANRARLAERSSGASKSRYQSLSGRQPQPYSGSARSSDEFEIPLQPTNARKVTPAAEARRTVTTAAAPSVGAVASAHLDLPTKTVTSHTTAKAPTSTVAELPLASAKKQIEVVVDEEDPAPVNQVGAKAIELPEAIEPAVTAKITTTLSASDPSCKSGELEAKRARSATSDADKLFYLRRAIRLCPSSVAYHLEIGEIYKSIGRDEDAAYEARQVLDLEPTNSAAKKLLSAVESAGVDQAATAAKVE